MKKISEVLNSPLRIGVFALCVVLIIAGAAFATIQAGASANVNKTIGLDKGVEVALADAGFKVDDVTNLTAHYDNDAGVASYDIDFTANGFDYDYTIKASDGTIIEATREAEQTPVLKENEIRFEDEIHKKEPAAETEPSEQAQTAPEPAKQSESKSEPKPEPQQTVEPPKQSSSPSSKYIGVDKAKSIALSNAGVSSSDAVFTKAKLDREDGVAVYEVDFYSGNTEYDYEINATTGKIRSKDIEREDYDNDWDDDWDDEWDD